MRKLLIPLVATTMVGLAAPASAQPIVLESYVGDRPADADGLVGPLLKMMRGRGYLVGKPLAKRIERRHSMPATVASAAELAEAARLAKSGRQQYIQGKFGAAITELTRARGILSAKPVTMVGNERARSVYFDTLIYLALAHSQQKSGKATAVMAELLRTFPNKSISRFRYGPAAQALSRKVMAKLRAQGDATIEVSLDNSAAVVFLNEAFRGTGNSSVANLKAGSYRLFTKVGSRAGRVHIVTANGGDKATKSISFAVDSTLRTQRFVGLQFQSEVERKARGPRNAIAIARSIGASSGVVILFVGNVKGQRAIYGARYNLDAHQPAVEAAISADNADAAALGNLARLLAGELETVPGNLLDDKGKGKGKGEGGGATTPPKNETTRVKRPYKTWKWVTLVSGAVGVAAGVTLIAMHEPEVVDGMRNLDARNTKTIGIISAGVGGALVVGGVLLWLKDKGHARERRMAVTPTQGGAMFALGGRF